MWGQPKQQKTVTGPPVHARASCGGHGSDGHGGARGQDTRDRDTEDRDRTGNTTVSCFPRQQTLLLLCCSWF